MKRSSIAGVIVFVLIILVGVAAALFWPRGGKSAVIQNLIPGLGTSAPSYSTTASGISVTAFSGYKLETTTLDGEQVPLIRIPVVTWGGYAALFAANGGAKPNKASLFYKYGKFAVEIIREEDPNKHIAGYASGAYPIIWSTMDTMPLLFAAVRSDKRVIPQVVGLFDWSFGGDGIIVRGDTKTPKDLKGKTIVTAASTPSHFFLLWLLSQSGLSPSDVKILYVTDALAAKDAFIADQKIDACVTWSPFIYEITDSASKGYVPGSRLLITSRDANQLIADVYAARLDFVKEKPEIVRGFVRGMMEGVDAFASNKEKILATMASFYELPGGANEAAAMVGDVHLANFPETRMFFDLDNPISAFKIFFLAQEYYRGVGALSDTASYEAESVLNAAFLDEMAKAGLFASQVNTIRDSFNKQGAFSIADLESKKVVLAEDIQIHFESQKIDFDFASTGADIQKNKRELAKIAEQMQVLGTTIVKLIGHLDTSKVEDFKKQGQTAYIEASAQAKLLSKRRAEYIKKLLVEKFGADATRIVTEGRGWEQPADETDQALNRRVEVRFFSLE